MSEDRTPPGYLYAGDAAAADGIWNPEGGGEMVREATRVVYSFIRGGEKFERDIEQIAVFIHSFGKHAKQREVPGRGFVSRAYFIEGYAKAGAEP